MAPRHDWLSIPPSELRWLLTELELTDEDTARAQKSTDDVPHAVSACG
jgi:hypothetical protein